MKSRNNIIKMIGRHIHHVSSDRNKVSEIKEQLSKNKITEDRIEHIFSEPEILESADIREIALLSEQIYLKTGIQELNPDNNFTEAEMKEARQFDYLLISQPEDISFPLELGNVISVGNSVYVATMDVKSIAKLMRNQLLYYNFEIQRQARNVRRKGSIIQRPTVYKKNVREIKNLLLKGQLIHTTLAFNAAVQTSNSHEELTFDPKTETLTINEGTRLDILDGFHRCLASMQAYLEDPEINFNFIVMISNFTTREAQQYQAQLAKATPIPKARAQELDAKRYADTVIRHLKAESELRNAISSGNGKVNRKTGELVNYRVLADAIDREFDMKSNLESREVSKWLTIFFEQLFGLYPQHFLSEEQDRNILMDRNRMFAGYVAIASEMKKRKINIEKLEVIMKNIDFSKDNQEWESIGLLSSDGNTNRKIDEREIGRFFRKKMDEILTKNN